MKSNSRKRSLHPRKIVLFFVVVVLIVVGVFLWHSRDVSGHTKAVDGRPAQAQRPKMATQKLAAKPKATTAAPSACAGNTLSQNVIVSISKRHLWACDGTTQKYDSAVVTGMENIAADLTPTGTYHIYSKQMDLYLKGSDSTGSWNDYVHYWMPWLSNQYGIYGFHDATWRKDGDFGNISPYSSNASHGCVELPLATAKWLYNWASVGTTVTINS